MQKIKIFEYSDYKKYVLDRVDALPKRGRGQLQKLAECLTVHPTLVSQVLRGSKDFTSEQACLAAQFLGLGETEADYFLALVECERAGNMTLKDYWRRRLNEAREFHRTSATFTRDEMNPLTEADRFQFYSSWEYSAVRLATSIDTMTTVETIAERLGLTVARVSQILQFLLDKKLCVEKDGAIRMGPQFTYLQRDSAQYLNHSQNWRLRSLAIPKHQLAPHELTFTMPVSISREDRKKVCDLMQQTVEEIRKIVRETKAEEELCFVTMDWLDMRK